jgi:1,4-dihydroxy-2-naphthoate octaprenyltransferase
MMKTPDQPVDRPVSQFQKWWVAARTFSLPASTMPVAFGTALAVTIGGAKLNIILFLAALVGMALLHAGANLLNDVYDYRKGIDRRVNPVSGSVVRGWITPRQALIAGWLCIGCGSLIGLWIYSQVGAPILWIGVSGVIIGVLYTWGPLPLKFNALGDLAVFLDFGILGALGAWTVQTGSLSWVPAVWAAPMSLLVIGILHANNWRDIVSDTQGRIHTVSSLLGDRLSEAYYALLLFGPFVFIGGLILVSWGLGLGPRMPLTFLITLLSAPTAYQLLAKGRQRHHPKHPLDFVALDGATAQLNLQFGLLCVAALGLHALFTALGWSA